MIQIEDVKQNENLMQYTWLQKRYIYIDQHNKNCYSYNNPAKEDWDQAYSEYKADALRVMLKLGWKEEYFYSDKTALQMTKNGQSIYFGTSTIVGNMSDEELESVYQALLEGAKVFHVWDKKSSNLYCILPDAESEMQMYHAAYDDKIFSLIQEHTTTKRSNLYKMYWEVMMHLCEQLVIDNNITHSGVYDKEKPICRYVEEKLTEYTEKGYLIRTDRYIRFANKKELKALRAA